MICAEPELPQVIEKRDRALFILEIVQTIDISALLGASNELACSSLLSPRIGGMTCIY